MLYSKRVFPSLKLTRLGVLNTWGKNKIKIHGLKGIYICKGWNTTKVANGNHSYNTTLIYILNERRPKIFSSFTYKTTTRSRSIRSKCTSHLAAHHKLWSSLLWDMKGAPRRLIWYRSKALHQSNDLNCIVQIVLRLAGLSTHCTCKHFCRGG